MKKLLTLLAFAFVAFTANAQSTQKGDINGDGDISVNDVAMIVNYILGNENSNFIIENADVNGDGSITVTDVAEAVNIILEGNGGNTPQSYLTCPDNNHPHIIDLGLPSGTLWACCNVGATKPEGYGGYYAWGEVQEKEAYYEEVTYQYATGVDIDGDGWYERDRSFQNLGSDIAGTQYDVAHVQWGGSWVMPSLNQIKELFDNCTYTWTTLNGVNGLSITGPNGGTIFLPAAGYRNYEGLEGAGWVTLYWSSTQVPSDECRAYVLDFFTDGSTDGRFEGLTVRPVSR